MRPLPFSGRSRELFRPDAVEKSMNRFAVLGAAMLLAAGPASAGPTVSHPFSNSIPRGQVRRVIIDIPSGDIAVRNGTADRIRIVGSAGREYDGYRARENAQRIADDIGAQIFVDGDEALVRRSLGPHARSWTARNWISDYRVTVEVPRGMNIEIDTHFGDLTIDGDFGDVTTDLRAGDIELRMPRASVRELTASVRIGEVHTDLGDDSEDHEGLFPGTTHFVNAVGHSRVEVHTTIGDVHVTLTR